MLTVTEIIVGVDSLPLTRGTLYVGEPGATNAQTDQVPVYWDESGEVAATQPITIRNGRPWRNGGPALLYVDDDYSMTALDRTGARAYHRARSPIAMAGIGSAQPSDPALTAISNLALDTTPQVVALSQSGDTATATGLVVGEDLQAHAAGLDAVTAGLVAADTAGPVDTDTGLPTRKPGFLRYNLDGTTSITEAFLSGIAYQSWVTEQITAATEGLGNNSLPANVLTMAQASALFLPINNVLPLLPRHLRYSSYSDFPQPATSSAPFAYNAFGTGGVIAAGTPEAGRSGVCILPGGTSANGGARIGGRRDGMIMVVGSTVSIKFKPLSVVDETLWIGLHNGNSATLPTDYAMFLMAPGGALTYGVRVASGTATSAGSATLIANQWYQADVTVTAAGKVHFLLFEDNLDGSGATLVDASVTTTLPTAAVGGHILEFTSYANATPRNVCAVDDIGLSESGEKY